MKEGTLDNLDQKRVEDEVHPTSMWAMIEFALMLTLPLIIPELLFQLALNGNLGVRVASHVTENILEYGQAIGILIVLCIFAYIPLVIGRVINPTGTYTVNAMSRMIRLFKRARRVP